MNEPKISKESPYRVKLEPGKKYYWCKCGESKAQPYCDGTHKEKGEFHSIPFEVFAEKEYYLCGCKKTKRPPYCDGTHNNI